MSQKEFRIFVELAKELGLKRASGFETYEGKYKGYYVGFEYDPDSYSKEHSEKDREFRIELYPLISFEVKVYNRNKKDIKKEILDKFDEYISREKPTNEEKNLINHIKNNSKATAKTLSEIEKEMAKASKMYLERIAKAFKVKVSYDNKVTIDNYTIIPLSTSPDLFAISLYAG